MGEYMDRLNGSQYNRQVEVKNAWVKQQQLWKQIQKQNMLDV